MLDLERAGPPVHQGACAPPISLHSGFTHTFNPLGMRGLPWAILGSTLCYSVKIRLRRAALWLSSGAPAEHVQSSGFQHCRKIQGKRRG